MIPSATESCHICPALWTGAACRRLCTAKSGVDTFFIRYTRPVSVSKNFAARPPPRVLSVRIESLYLYVTSSVIQIFTFVLECECGARIDARVASWLCPSTRASPRERHSPPRAHCESLRTTEIYTSMRTFHMRILDMKIAIAVEFL